MPCLVPRGPGRDSIRLLTNFCLEWHEYILCTHIHVHVAGNFRPLLFMADLISSFSSPLSSKLMRAGGGNGRQYV